jgi:hypothetical protein
VGDDKTIWDVDVELEACDFCENADSDVGRMTLWEDDEKLLCICVCCWAAAIRWAVKGALADGQ